MATLTRYLCAHQARTNASDQDFAARIGLEPEIWAAIRSGDVVYTAPLIARILSRFPCALSAVLDDLHAGELLSAAAASVDDPWPAHEQPQPAGPTLRAA